MIADSVWFFNPDTLMPVPQKPFRGSKVNVGQYLSSPSGIKTQHIVMILDRSGSMQATRDAAINAFNAQLDTIQRLSENNRIHASFLTFNQDVYEHFFESYAHHLEKLNRYNYQPEGWTALNDAVGYAIEKLKKETPCNDHNHTYLVVIVSDGQENHSRYFNNDSVRNRIQTLQNTGRWTFTYLSCNQEDAREFSKNYTVPIGNVGTYEHTAAGFNCMGQNLSRNIETYCCAVDQGQTASASFTGSTPEQIVEMSNVDPTVFAPVDPNGWKEKLKNDKQTA